MAQHGDRNFDCSLIIHEMGLLIGVNGALLGGHKVSQVSIKDLKDKGSQTKASITHLVSY